MEIIAVCSFRFNDRTYSALQLNVHSDLDRTKTYMYTTPYGLFKFNLYKDISVFLAFHCDFSFKISKQNSGKAQCTVFWLKNREDFIKYRFYQLALQIQKLSPLHSQTDGHFEFNNALHCTELNFLHSFHCLRCRIRITKYFILHLNAFLICIIHKWWDGVCFHVELLLIFDREQQETFNIRSVSNQTIDILNHPPILDIFG